MRIHLRYIADALSSAAFGVLMLVLHFSLVSVCKANLHRVLAVPRHRPIYSRSGRRNRVRC